MDNRRTYIWICGIVFLTAGGAAPYAFANQEMKEINKITTEQSPEKDKFEIELPAVFYSSENFKDPFQSVIIEEPQGSQTEEIKPIETIELPDLKIQGIIWGTSAPQAIINNKVVKVGSSINDITIVDITGSEIIIDYKNQKFKLPAPSGIRTPDKHKGGKDGK